MAPEVPGHVFAGRTGSKAKRRQCLQAGDRDSLESSRQRAPGNAEPFQRQDLPNTAQRPLEKKLLHQQPNPEGNGEHAFGDKLGRWRGRDNAGDRPAVAGTAVSGPFMDAADQPNLPLDHLGTIGAGEHDERLATNRTSLLVFRQIMHHFFRGKLRAAFSAMPFCSTLLASLASFCSRRFGTGRNIPIAILRFRSDVLGQFGFSAEHLLLQPRHPGLQCFVFSGQLRDLSRLVANDPFKLPSPFFECRFPLDGPGMESPPVVGLLAKGNLGPPSLDILNQHAGILRGQGLCVQRSKKEAGEDQVWPRVH